MSSIMQTSGRELLSATVKNPHLADWHSPCDIAPEPKDDGSLDKAIEGPVLTVTTFKYEAEALAIANNTLYGLGAGVWSRNCNVAYRIGRETHKVMLDHYQQTKNLLVSYAEQKLGFF